MNLKKIKSNSKIVSFISNIFVLILIPFIVWMLFFDDNSYATHRKYNKEINGLENTIQFYKSKIIKDKTMIKGLQDSLQLERFAREKYLMKKDNEDIYIIAFDTLKK